MDFPEDFQAAYKELLKWEGDTFVDDPEDPGGATKFGISKREYPGLDIKNLTLAAAMGLTFTDYWCRFRLNELMPAFGSKMLSLVFDMGAAAAVRCLQRACRACGNAVAEDGELGPLTVDVADTLAKTHPEALMAALRSEAWGYYSVLMANNWRLQKFRNGWMKRAYA